MKEGYRWFRVRHGSEGWHICYVKKGYVHFFGEISQVIGNTYLSECVEFGDYIELPEE